MSKTIEITLLQPARFVEVEKKTSQDGEHLSDASGAPLWRFRCLIGTEVRAVTCPATTEEVKALKPFAPVYFRGLAVGAFKDFLYLRATGLEHNPDRLPLRTRP